MNFLDIIILVILCFFSIMSFFRGFIREAFALIGLVLGIIAANLFYSRLGVILSRSITNSILANLTAYVLILIAVAVVVIIIGRLLDKFIKLSLLKWLDRILGLGFGLIKGLIIVYILIFVLGIVLPSNNSLLENSQLRPVVLKLYSIVPDNFLKNLNDRENSVIKKLFKKPDSEVRKIKTDSKTDKPVI